MRSLRMLAPLLVLVSFLTAASGSAANTDVPSAPAASPTTAPAPAPAPGSPAQQSLLSNGDFSKLDATGYPVDWPKNVKGITAKLDGVSTYLQFVSSDPGKTVLAYRKVSLKQPLPPALELRLKVRYDVVPGKNSWFDARVMLKFKDKNNKDVSTPSAPYFRGSSKGQWVTRSVFFAVPANADALEIMPTLFQVKEGTLDLAECSLWTANLEQVPAPPPKVPSPSEALKLDDSAKLAPALRVVGTQLQTDDGKPVHLQGLSLDSLQWAPGGEHLPDSIVVAIEQWHANTIRLPVTGKMWWGQGKGQKRDLGMQYRSIVDACVKATVDRGAYLVLDLHRFGKPTEDDVLFWKDAAARYRNHPAVIFELFNEPHSLSWKAWRDGASDDEDHKDANVAENNEKSSGATVGMQALLDAVRSTGATNVVIAGGLDWGYDLSGVVNGYALTERQGGRGIVYSSHIYPWKKNWQHNTLDAAAKFPIFIGEVGCPQKWEDFKFIPPAQQYEKLGPECTWPNDVIGMIQQNKLHWTGFSFHPKCGPCIITDWNYTPTDYWGIFVKRALAGEKFTMQRMR